MPGLRRVRALVLGLLGATALVAVPFTQVAEATPNQTYERLVHDKTNAQRDKYDRARLGTSACLDRFAERHAKRLAEQRRLYHQQLRPILEECKLRAVGENVAYGYSSGTAAVNAWMKSPGHKANILNRSYRMQASGAYRGKDGRWYVAQVFGTRA